MPSGAVPNFLPSKNGFRFVNSFPHEPALTVRVPVYGAIEIGDASNGLCGGMTYAVRDFFEAKLPPPADSGPPAEGSPLFRYIVRRLIDSWDLPDGVLRYFVWMSTPDADAKLWLYQHRGIAWQTFVEEWPKVRADIDAGRPSPLGLVTVQSHNPGDLGKNHQVVAYAYELDGNRLTLRLYDPNTDPETADGVTLSADISDPSHAAGIRHNVGIALPIRGFFRTDYRFNDPSALGPSGS
jgi:hypothetical protein